MTNLRLTFFLFLFGLAWSLEGALAQQDAYFLGWSVGIRASVRMLQVDSPFANAERDLDGVRLHKWGIRRNMASSLAISIRFAASTMETPYLRTYLADVVNDLESQTATPRPTESWQTWEKVEAQERSFAAASKRMDKLSALVESEAPHAGLYELGLIEGLADAARMLAFNIPNANNIGFNVAVLHFRYHVRLAASKILLKEIQDGMSNVRDPLVKAEFQSIVSVLESDANKPDTSMTWDKNIAIQDATYRLVEAKMRAILDRALDKNTSLSACEKSGAHIINLSNTQPYWNSVRDSVD